MGKKVNLGGKKTIDVDEIKKNGVELYHPFHSVNGYQFYLYEGWVYQFKMSGGFSGAICKENLIEALGFVYSMG